MRIVVVLLGVQPHLLQHLPHPLFPFLFGNLAVDYQGFGHDVSNPHAGTEGGPGVLEHGLYQGPILLQLRALEGLNVPALK